MNEANMILDGINKAVEVALRKGLNPDTVYLNPKSYKVMEEQVSQKYPMVDYTRMHGAEIRIDSNVGVSEVYAQDSTVTNGFVKVDM